MTGPLVAIVILNWNGRAFLEKFLPSVISSSYNNKRIIVADNASTDDSILFLKANFPAVEIIQNKNNEGFAKGYNTALKQVQADYYVLLNSDVEVTPGWIEPVISLLESDKKIGVCQPKLLAYHDKERFEYAGAAGGWIDFLGYPFSRGRVFEHCEKDEGQYDTAMPCFWATGAAMFVRAELYHALGGLDDYFFAHQEEIDFCWRVQLKGYKVYCEPASVVYHVGGGTLPKGNSKKTYLNFRNNLIMMAKNQTITVSCWKIPIRFLLDAIVSWKELLGGNKSFFVAVIKAHFHFMKWLFFVKKSNKKTSDKKAILLGYYHGSVVIDYFIKKKNSFREIIGIK
jgi:hypothetical protein